MISNLIAERFDLPRVECGLHVAIAETSGSVGPEPEDFVVICNEEGFIAQVAENAGDSNLEPKKSRYKS